MGISDDRRRRLLHDLVVRDRIQDPRINAIKINRLKTVDSVALDAPSVALHQDVRTDLSILLRKPRCLKSIHHEITYQFPTDIRSCLFIRHSTSSL